MATRRKRAARASTDNIVITLSPRGKIKHVQCGKKRVSRPSLNLKRSYYQAARLGEIANFHVMRFKDIRTGATLRCIHSANCFMFCF